MSDRKRPICRFTQSFVIINAIALPVFWALMHVPFIWPEMLAGFVAVLCVSINNRPYNDWLRGVATLIAAILLLTCKVRFEAEIFGFHIETGLYYLAIGASCVSLWRRFWNWLAWSQIDRMCDKYQIPRYNQKSLMDAYEGIDTHYGEPKPKRHKNYQEAVAASQQNETTEDS